MSASHIRTTEAAAIRDLVEDWARAVRARNLDGILAHHSPNILYGGDANCTDTCSRCSGASLIFD